MSVHVLIRQLHETLFRLESDIKTQKNLDSVYNEFTFLIKEEMTRKLDYKIVKIQDGSSE